MRWERRLHSFAEEIRGGWVMEADIRSLYGIDGGVGHVSYGDGVGIDRLGKNNDSKPSHLIRQIVNVAVSMSDGIDDEARPQRQIKEHSLPAPKS